MKHKKRIVIAVSAVIIAVGLFIIPTVLFRKGPYTAEELGIEHITSSLDSDSDGIDNYTDMMLSARKYISQNPRYESKYYAGGYPDDGSGVCTDVIWQAFMGAGIDLKALIDEDIKASLSSYETIERPDPNIDFRRVRNLKAFFERHARSLTIDINEVAEWQPGDIVVLDPSHIAIVSDKRNRKGIPYIIHHSPLGAVEADDMYLYKSSVIGHYRFGE